MNLIRIKWLRKVWEWFTDFEVPQNLTGWRYYLEEFILIPVRGIIIGLLPFSLIIYLVFVNPKVGIWFILILLWFMSERWYRQKRRSEHLERKYDELLGKLRKIQKQDN